MKIKLLKYLLEELQYLKKQITIPILSRRGIIYIDKYIFLEGE
jgi:hypothetical protein